MKPVSSQTSSRFVWIAFDDVERQEVEQRIGPQVLGGGEQAEDHLQAEQEQGDDEVRIRDALRAVPHGLPLTAA